MNLDKVKQLKNLVNAAKSLKTLAVDYGEVIKDSRCDKHAFCFGGDDRFAVFSTKIFLDCHTGYYGNSSCSTFRSIPNDIAQRALNKVLNRNRNRILDEMAEAIMDEARAAHGAAKQELQSFTQALEESMIPESEEESNSEQRALVAA